MGERVLVFFMADKPCLTTITGLLMAVVSYLISISIVTRHTRKWLAIIQTKFRARHVNLPVTQDLFYCY